MQYKYTITISGKNKVVLDNIIGQLRTQLFNLRGRGFDVSEVIDKGVYAYTIQGEHKLVLEKYKESLALSKQRSYRFILLASGIKLSVTAPVEA